VFLNFVFTYRQMPNFRNDMKCSRDETPERSSGVLNFSTSRYTSRYSGTHFGGSVNEYLAFWPLGHGVQEDAPAAEIILSGQRTHVFSSSRFHSLVGDPS
jgi:hypothetical protein